MEKFGVFIIRDLEGTSRGIRRWPPPNPMSSTSTSHSGGDLPLRMHTSRAIHSMGYHWAGEHHRPLTILQPTYYASFPVTTLICNSLSLSKTENTSSWQHR